MQTISEMSESIDINTISTNNVSDDLSLNNCHNSTNLCVQTPVTTPEPKSVSNPSGSGAGSRSEIHYPGVQNPSRIYDSKKNRKIVRIMTVLAYMFAVSLAAIVLSLYYAFLWNPNMQINNSTHLLAKKTNIDPGVVLLRQEADSTDIESQSESDQVQDVNHNRVLANQQPIRASAHLLTGSQHQPPSDSGLLMPTTNTTTKRNSVYSSNMLSSIEHKQSASKSLSKTYETNVATVGHQRMRISDRAHNRLIGDQTDANVLNGTNRTEINIVDNQIEISLNTSQTLD